MPDKKGLASLSIICILTWVFVFGLLLPSDEPIIGQNENIIIIGTVISTSPGNSSGGSTLQINDGGRTWSCLLDGGVACPKVGELIVAYCDSQPGGVLLIARIGAP